MQRFFFDYVSKDEMLSDYQGRYFSAADAREYARILAIHLQYDPEDAYVGWSVAARDGLGAEICRVSVLPPDNNHGAAFKALPSDAVGNRGSGLAA